MLKTHTAAELSQLLCTVGNAQSEPGGKTLVAKQSIEATLKTVIILIWHVKETNVYMNIILLTLSKLGVALETENRQQSTHCDRPKQKYMIARYKQ